MSGKGKTGASDGVPADSPAKLKDVKDKDKDKKEKHKHKDAKDKDKDVSTKDKDKHKDKDKRQSVSIPPLATPTKDKEPEKTPSSSKVSTAATPRGSKPTSEPTSNGAKPASDAPSTLSTPRRTSVSASEPNTAANSSTTDSTSTTASTESKPTTISSATSSTSLDAKKKKKKAKKKRAAEPTKWADVKEAEENGDFLDELEDDELDDVPLDDDDDTDGEDLRQYLQDMEDPLGIGGGDQRKGKSQQDFDDSDEDEESSASSVAWSPRKAKRIASRKMKGALDPTDEKFDAVMYLVKVHQNTPIEELQRGKARLEVKVTSRQRQLEFLVKDNFSRFMICKDAVDDIYMTISGQKLNANAKIVDLATASFSDLFNRSTAVFTPLLKRQTEIDRIKSVLGILKRSQFIFNLPRRMRDNIAAGEYSKVVLNYKKVRSLVATASHASIKNVVSEVDAIVRELHATLFEHLEQPTASLKQQEEYIKLLVDLGSPVDPAWYTLELRHTRMKSMLLERAAKAAPVPESPHFSLGIAQAQQQRNAAILIPVVSNMLQEHMPAYLHLANNFFGRFYHKSLSEKKKTALSLRHSVSDFLVKLHELLAIYSDIVIRSFYGPAARNMAEAAKLQTRSDFNNATPSDEIPNKATAGSSPTMIITGKKKKTRPRTNTRSASSDVIPTSLKSQMASAMSESHVPGTSQAASGTSPTGTSQLSATTNDTSSLVLNRSTPAPSTTLPQTSLISADEPLQDKEKVMAILKLFQQLQPLLPSPDSEWLTPLSELLDVVTRTFVRELFSDVLFEARTWYSQEDWLVLDQQRMITALPYTFESALTSTLDRLEGLVMKNDPLTVFVQKKFIECIECFVDNIHHLTFINTEVNLMQEGTTSDERDDESTGSEDEAFQSNRYDALSISADSRLLIVLNNCTYTKKHILPSLLERFKEQYGVELYGPKARHANELFEQLEDMILRKYVTHKTFTLNEIIRSGVLFSGFDWGGITVPPTGLRDFVMSALLELVFVHDELHRVSRSLLRPVLSTVLENIYQCFLDCLQHIDTVSNHGVLQLGMELDFLSSVMRKYKSPIATGLANELDHILQYNSIMDPKSDEVLAKDKKIVKALLSSKLQEASLLVECFTGIDASDLKA
jgi:hypothetical protein